MGLSLRMSIPVSIGKAGPIARERRRPVCRGYDDHVTDLQVLLDPRGVTSKEMFASVGTLLGQVPHVEVVEPTDSQIADLLRRFDSRVSRASCPRAGVPVLVTSGHLCWAAGSVRRVLKDLATPGRSLTRVLVPGLPAAEGQAACWGPQWLAGFTGSVTDLVDADLAFDRDHLPRASPLARSWVRADAIGLAPVAEVGADSAQRWSRMAGLDLARQELLASVRAPLGSARRRLGRRRQRAQAPPTTHRTS